LIPRDPSAISIDLDYRTGCPHVGYIYCFWTIQVFAPTNFCKRSCGCLCSAYQVQGWLFKIGFYPKKFIETWLLGDSSAWLEKHECTLKDIFYIKIATNYVL
jgi:hypothetical protein